eukprot:14649313-Alexandrium_andersonii.AAC.1
MPRSLLRWKPSPIGASPSSSPVVSTPTLPAPAATARRTSRLGLSIGCWRGASLRLAPQAPPGGPRTGPARHGVTGSACRRGPMLLWKSAPLGTLRSLTTPASRPARPPPRVARRTALPTACAACRRPRGLTFAAGTRSSRPGSASP